MGRFFGRSSGGSSGSSDESLGTDWGAKKARAGRNAKAANDRPQKADYGDGISESDVTYDRPDNVVDNGWGR